MDPPRSPRDRRAIGARRSHGRAVATATGAPRPQVTSPASSLTPGVVPAQVGNPGDPALSNPPLTECALGSQEWRGVPTPGYPLQSVWTGPRSASQCCVQVRSGDPLQLLHLLFSYPSSSYPGQVLSQGQVRSTSSRGAPGVILRSRYHRCTFVLTHTPCPVLPTPHLGAEGRRPWPLRV